MTVSEFRSLLSAPEYDFLRENKYFPFDRLVFLTLGGSHAYGTNVEGSDVDIRGCALNSASDLLGLAVNNPDLSRYGRFEQLVDVKTDTTVYSFNRFVSLLLDCNPNVIEMLGCKPEHYIVQTSVGCLLVDNRKLFLSKRSANSFGGYAEQQLRRLENAIARDRVPQAVRETHILHSVENSLNDFCLKHSNLHQSDIRLFTKASEKAETELELCADIDLKAFPLREFNVLMNTLTNVCRSYDKTGHRNHKKDSAHLNKHAMHLIRLYIMGLEILECGDFSTYRENEREFLLEIRNGKYQNADGSYRPEFFEMVNDYEKRFDYAKRNTSLPEQPDFERIQEFVMDVNRRSVF